MIGFRSDVFLDRFSICERKIVLVTFAQAVKQAEFVKGPKKILVAETVIDTAGCLSQAFKANLRYDWRIEPYGSLLFLLEQTFKGYTNEDPGTKQQKAFPIIIFLKILDLAHTELATSC